MNRIEVMKHIIKFILLEDESSKSLEKKSYYQNGKLRTIEIFNNKNKAIETKLYDSINGNLLTVLTHNSI